eukprot:CAMPEP_0185478196 /NCGR_PEP_ID=MMETSP1366-20130426/4594_1 /TAXON_ID=38817 /ORGANISM="Gephyrocapsa oceanica, Strain RCC1303" /LENGTH=38 /DNA_ID= /DNA_START= /DNA_END= /DNA_ORIENTATION=
MSLLRESASPTATPTGTPTALSAGAIALGGAGERGVGV